MRQSHEIGHKQKEGNCTMVYSYFPGCTLKTKGRELDEYGRKAAAALEMELRELPEWQCCGAVYPMGKDEIASKLSSVRALVSAREQGTDLVTLCSACHHVIKRVNGDMRNDENMQQKANNYLQLETPYTGETNVLHYLEVLRDRVGFETLKEKVKNPLTGKKIAAYYGCLLLRPSKEMQMDNAENPTIMEDFIRAIGAEPVVYAMRNECCGGYVTLENKEFAANKAKAIMDNAKKQGAEAVITACPLCMYNLKENGGSDLPVYYFTELLAEALGVK